MAQQQDIKTSSYTSCAIQSPLTHDMTTNKRIKEHTRVSTAFSLTNACSFTVHSDNYLRSLALAEPLSLGRLW
jgi:hypothetical protein